MSGARYFCGGLLATCPSPLVYAAVGRRGTNRVLERSDTSEQDVVAAAVVVGLAKVLEAPDALVVYGRIDQDRRRRPQPRQPQIDPSALEPFELAARGSLEPHLLGWPRLIVGVEVFAEENDPSIVSRPADLQRRVVTPQAHVRLRRPPRHRSPSSRLSFHRDRGKHARAVTAEPTLNLPAAARRW